MEKEIKTVVIKQKIDEDFIIDLYKKAQKCKGEKKKKMMDQVRLLSQNIGSYLVR